MNIRSLSTPLIFSSVSIALCGCATTGIFTSTRSLAGGEALVAGSASLGFYALPYVLTNVSVTFPACTSEQLKGGCPEPLLALDATPTTTVPDVNHIYQLSGLLSSNSSDTLTVEVDTHGLLKSIESNTKDETGAIILKVAEGIKEAAKAAASTSATFASGLVFMSRVTSEGVAVAATSFPEVIVSAKLDLSANAEPTIREFDRRLSEPSKRYGPSNRFYVHVSRPSLKLLSPEIGASDSAATRGCRRGVCYRPVLPYGLSLSSEPVSDANRSAPPQLVVALPNDAPVLSIDLERTGLVTRKGRLDFTDGLLAKVYVDKPSEALAAVSIPVAFLNTIVSIPAELLTLRIKQTTDRGTLIDQQISLLDKQIKLNKAIADAAKQ